MTAKERHRVTLVEYLGNPDNGTPKRSELVSVCGISNATFYQHFTPDELVEIEKEALEIRRSLYTPHLAKADLALFKKAEEGDVAAIKLAYQKFEGWTEKQGLEHSGPNGNPIETEFIVNFKK